jgi:hypothetical protein
MAVVIAALAGCAAPRAHLRVDPAAECREVYRRVDQVVLAAGVADGMSARVADFPYLRVSRFLASYAGEAMNDAQFADWMSRMIELGRHGYEIELANLPAENADALGAELREVDRKYAWAGPALADCAARLAAADYSDVGRRSALRQAAHVPDEYLTWQRVAGLYWLTRIPFAAGIRRWQRQVQELFSRPETVLRASGELKTYAPPPPPSRLSPSEIAELLRRAASSSALGIPDLRGGELEAVFRAYAPEFVVEATGDADLPGELGWEEGDAPRVVSTLPVVYRRVSHARYQGNVLLQLSYTLWFPERPREGAWDLLAGHLDGVVWRVTLAPDGTPWIFDSMHACGCYHFFFPTRRAAIRPQPDTLDETAFTPQTLPAVDAGQRVVLRLASGTHYLQRVGPRTAPAPGAEEYVFAEDDVLRSLPLPATGRRSLYRPDGIVPGTERAERYFFWPMGVPEPGAMRQWGRHATAFVGRRHFDDPGMLERYFSLQEP